MKLTPKLKKALMAAVVAALAAYGFTLSEEQQGIISDLFETEQTE